MVSVIRSLFFRGSLTGIKLRREKEVTERSEAALPGSHARPLPKCTALKSAASEARFCQREQVITISLQLGCRTWRTATCRREFFRMCYFPVAPG